MAERKSSLAPAVRALFASADVPVAVALRRVLARGYTVSDLKADVMAGAVVGVVALPLSMALAIAVGAPPEHGLYTAIVAGFLVALLGGSKHQVTGPTGLVALENVLVRLRGQKKIVVIAGPLPQPREVFDKANLEEHHDHVFVTGSLEEAIRLGTDLVLLTPTSLAPPPASAKGRA